MLAYEGSIYINAHYILAEDAFIKVGKLLQSRRKADLYETVTHYGGRDKDPAQSDPTLAAKLNENQKNCKKISDVLEKFARKQDMPEVEEDEDDKAENNKLEEKCDTTTTSRDAEDATGTAELKTNNKDKDDQETVNMTDSDTLNKDNANKVEDGECDDDDDEDDDEEDADLEQHVETLANGDESDNESDNENSTKDDKKRSTADETQTEQINTKNDSFTKETTIDVAVVSNIVDICDTSQIIDVDCTDNDTTNDIRTASNNSIEERPETKTVTYDTVKDCMTPPPNGKLKDLTKLNVCPSNLVATMPIANASNSNNTTSDVRIVTVSSLKAEVVNITPKNSDCSSALFAESTNKSLEEIVISDEES